MLFWENGEIWRAEGGGGGQGGWGGGKKTACENFIKFLEIFLNCMGKSAFLLIGIY